MSETTETTVGLTSGQQWAAIPEKDKPLEWSMDPDGEFMQGPLDLTCLRGKKISLNLNEDQLALYTLSDDLRAIYLAGGHVLDVGTRPGQISPQGRLYFLALDQTLDLRWTHGNPIDLPGFETQHIIGNCQLMVTGPSLFYDQFIKPAALPEFQTFEDFKDILEKTVFGALSDFLGTPGHATLQDPAGLQSSLMNLQAESLGENLLYCGLSCTHLALYTAQPPVEDCQPGPVSNERTGQSPQLAHN